MPDQSRQISLRRIFVSFATAFSFAISLSYPNLSQPIKTISFLFLPFHKAFDPSLVYLAVGALPLTLLLYKYGRGNEKPRLCGTWDVPKDGKIDTKLISGALLFGLGWGIGGRCRASLTSLYYGASGSSVLSTSHSRSRPCQSRPSPLHGIWCSSGYYLGRVFCRRWFAGESLLAIYFIGSTKNAICMLCSF